MSVSSSQSFITNALLQLEAGYRGLRVNANVVKPGNQNAIEELFNFVKNRVSTSKDNSKGLRVSGCVEESFKFLLFVTYVYVEHLALSQNVTTLSDISKKHVEKIVKNLYKCTKTSSALDDQSNIAAYTKSLEKFIQKYTDTYVNKGEGKYNQNIQAFFIKVKDYAQKLGTASNECRIISLDDLLFMTFIYVKYVSLGGKDDDTPVRYIKTIFTYLDKCVRETSMRIMVNASTETNAPLKKTINTQTNNMVTTKGVTSITPERTNVKSTKPSKAFDDKISISAAVRDALGASDRDSKSSQRVKHDNTHVANVDIQTSIHSKKTTNVGRAPRPLEIHPQWPSLLSQKQPPQSLSTINSPIPSPSLVNVANTNPPTDKTSGITQSLSLNVSVDNTQITNYGPQNLKRPSLIDFTQDMYQEAFTKIETLNKDIGNIPLTVPNAKISDKDEVLIANLVQRFSELVKCMLSVPLIFKLSALTVENYKKLIDSVNANDAISTKERNSLVSLLEFFYLDITNIFYNALSNISEYTPVKDYITKENGNKQKYYITEENNKFNNYHTNNYNILTNQNQNNMIFVYNLASALRATFGTSESIESIIPRDKKQPIKELPICIDIIFKFIKDFSRLFENIKLLIDIQYDSGTRKIHIGFVNNVEKLLREQNNAKVMTYLKIRNDKLKTYHPRYNIKVNTENEGDNMNTLIVKYNDVNIPYYTYNATSQKRSPSVEIKTNNKIEGINTSTNTILPSESSFTQTYYFGKFNKIFLPYQDNETIAHDLIDIKSALVKNKPVFILGYGASGAGKTSTLIRYNDKSDDKKSEDGVLTELCNYIATEGLGEGQSKRKYTTVHVKTKEYYYGSVGEVKNVPTNGKALVFTYEYKDKEFKLSTTYTHTPYHKYRSGPSNHDFQNHTTLGEALIYLVDTDRFVKATTNNPNSSRSHTLIFLTFKHDNANAPDLNIIVGDFAGVENKFNCDDENELKRFIAVKGNDGKTPFYSAEINEIGNADPVNGGRRIKRRQRGGEKVVVSDECKPYIVGNIHDVVNIATEPVIRDVPGVDIGELKTYYEQKGKNLNTDVTNILSTWQYNIDDLLSNFIKNYEQLKKGDEGRINMLSHLKAKCKEMAESVNNSRKIVDSPLETKKNEFSRANVYKEIMKNFNIINHGYNSAPLPKPHKDVNHIPPTPTFKYINNDKLLKPHLDLKDVIDAYNNKTKEDILDDPEFNFVKLLNDFYTFCKVRFYTFDRWEDRIDAYNDFAIFTQFFNEQVQKMFNIDNDKLKILPEIPGNYKNEIKWRVVSDYYTSTLEILKQIKVNAYNAEAIIKAINNQVEGNNDFSNINVQFDINNIIYQDLSTFIDAIEVMWGEREVQQFRTDKSKLIPRLLTFLQDRGTVEEVQKNADIFIALHKYIQAIQKEKECRMKFAKDICVNRVEEGEFINKSLADVRETIKQILVTKSDSQNTINGIGAPSFIDVCLGEYCPLKSRCFEIERTITDKVPDAPPSRIFKDIMDELEQGGKYSGKTSKEKTKAFYQDIVVAIFGVWNVSDNANINNHPPVPYIDITPIKKAIKVGLVNLEHNKLQDLAKDIKDVKAKITDKYNNKLPDLINDELTEKLNNVISHMTSSLDNHDVLKQHEETIIEFVKIIDTNNAATSIGALEFIDQMAKFNTVDLICTGETFQRKMGKDNNMSYFLTEFQDLIDANNNMSRVRARSPDLAVHHEPHVIWPSLLKG